jgi:hypothetical protein
MLASAGVAIMNGYMRVNAERDDLFHLDASMTLLAIGLSLLSGFVAGAYPAYRVCSVAPAAHLGSS